MHPKVLGLEAEMQYDLLLDRVSMLERDRHLHKINLSSIKALKTIK